jgi:hypothetical protein
LRGTPMPEDGNRAFQKAKMLQKFFLLFRW